MLIHAACRSSASIFHPPKKVDSSRRMHRIEDCTSPRRSVRASCVHMGEKEGAWGLVGGCIEADMGTTHGREGVYGCMVKITKCFTVWNTRHLSNVNPVHTLPYYSSTPAGRSSSLRRQSRRRPSHEPAPPSLSPAPSRSAPRRVPGRTGWSPRQSTAFGSDEERERKDPRG